MFNTITTFQSSFNTTIKLTLLQTRMFFTNTTTKGFIRTSYRTRSQFCGGLCRALTDAFAFRAVRLQQGFGEGFGSTSEFGKSRFEEGFGSTSEFGKSRFGEEVGGSVTDARD